MSQVNTILKDMQDAREEVMALCNLTDDQLNQMQWDAALECLKKVLRSDEYGIYNLPKTADFWLWWKDQWYRRDDKFLNALKWDIETSKYTCPLPGEEVRLFLHGQEHITYVYLHYHRIAADNPLVNNEGLEISFHQLIKEIAKHK